MATPKPKRRAIRAREERILEIAREMFFEQGYHGLTMGKIAQCIGCAKGTVYNHFPCKEDLLVKLALESHDRRLVLFRRAIAIEGSWRERMEAVAFAAELFLRMHPGDMQLFFSITGPIREKTSPEIEAQLEAKEATAMRLITSVVDGALVAGDLALPEGLSVGEVTWEYWCLHEGAQKIILSGIDLYEMGLDAPFRSLRKLLRKTADSHGWKPLSSEYDYDALVQRFETETFRGECAKLDMDAQIVVPSPQSA